MHVNPQTTIKIGLSSECIRHYCLEKADDPAVDRLSFCAVSAPCWPGMCAVELRSGAFRGKKLALKNTFIEHIFTKQY